MTCCGSIMLNNGKGELECKMCGKHGGIETAEEFFAWERHFILLAFHLLWENWPVEGEHPHNDTIGNTLEKLTKCIGAE
jgi:hypothetical protein